MSETQVEANQHPADSPGGALNVVARAARDGAADAREAANRTFAATSLFASRFVYTTCYTISYGVVFSATLLARSIPRENAAVRGLIEGAQAARDRVEQMQGVAAEPAPA